jgi:hypothetical protein
VPEALADAPAGRSSRPADRSAYRPGRPPHEARR